MTIAEQWFVVFDIVCPGQAHPLSPYHDSEVSEVVFTDLREFVTGTSGVNIVFSELHQSVALGPQIETSLREALSRGLGNLIDGWIMRRRALPEPFIIDELPDASSSLFASPFASPYTFLQPYPMANQDMSYVSGPSQNATPLQDSVLLDGSLGDDLLLFEADYFALPDPEDWIGSALPEGSNNDEEWRDDSANDAGYDPAAYQ